MPLEWSTAPTTDVITDGAVVRLSVPCSLRYVRLIRLASSDLADRLGFDIDDIDDLRVAVDELASALVDAAGHGSVDVEFRIRPGILEIDGRTPSGARPVLDELTTQILGAVVDEYEVGSDERGGRFRCLKRTIPTDA